MNSLKKGILAIIIATSFGLIGANNYAWAQATHLTASNLGIGGGGTAYLDSYHANFVNPANLMLNEGVKPRFSMGLLGGLSATGGGSLINIGVYNEYFTKGLTVSGEVATEALDAWFGASPGSMRNAGIQLDVVPLGISYRGQNWSMSAAFRSRVLFSTGISRAFAELGLHGLDSKVFGTPRSVDFTVNSLAFNELSFGYARRLLTIPKLALVHNVRVYAGIAPKLLMGGHTSGIDFRSTLHLEGASENEIDVIRHEFTYTVETNGEMATQLDQFYRDRQEQGRVPDIGDYLNPADETFDEYHPAGWGFDIGATAEMDIRIPVIGAIFKGDEKLAIGVSVTDIGELSFKDKIGSFSADNILEWRGFKFDQERIDREFDGDRDAYMKYVLKDSLATEVYGSFSPNEKQEITRPLPTMVNFGARLTMNKLSLSADFNKGFREMGTGSKRFAFITGLEYQLLGFMPLRVGMRSGGMSSTAYTAGIGLEFKHFEFSVAGLAVRESKEYGSSAGAAWSGFVFRF